MKSPSRDADDAELAEALVAGSEAALAAVYERYRRVVYGQAFAETASRVDAEEVLQDAFLTLWQKRRRVRLVGGSVLPWLLVTARNLARNRRRHQWRRAADQLPFELVSTSADPAAIAVADELARAITAALDRLDPLDRELLQLCLGEGMSYQDAADHLQSTHATVRNRLSRARRTVRLHLGTERGS